MGKAVGIRGVVLEHHEGVAVEAVEALLGAEPQEAHVVLKHRLHRALGKALLDRQAGKASGGRRLHHHGQRGRRGQYRPMDPARPHGTPAATTDVRLPRGDAEKALSRTVPFTATGPE